MEFLWLCSTSRKASDLSDKADIQVVERMEDGLRLTARASFGALIVEIGELPDRERAFALLERAREFPPVWIFDLCATPLSTATWIKSGAVHVVDRESDLHSLMDQATEPCEQVNGVGALMGGSRALREVAADIELVANRHCNLLIEGETGTGKEVVARETHRLGNRCRGPWVAVNCGAIPEALLEAELFGHVKGAFTGAVQSRAGKFEAANNGTIFLDEIGDMPFSTQSKLLRVLQEREVERLGGNERIQLNVRVIAATNVNLAERVRAGLFREDLYYRLNVFRIALPPLRDRHEDIPQLARHFARKVCLAERLAVKTIDPAAMDRLRAHDWPGNIRELENAIEAAVIVSGNRSAIFPSDLRLPRRASQPTLPSPAPQLTLPAEGLDYQKALEGFELNLLTQALTRSRGNKTAAADLLQLKRTTLTARMRVLESRLPRLVA